jgi:UDP-GlcNAc:undecaprenyl-phosphate GlcNAc-1-phosphate transferase
MIPFSATIIDLGNWGILITVLWLVGMTNLINLIDGADGLAGGICLMLMVLLAYVGHESGSFELLVSGMAGALLAFLWFNFPPARIYLGDGGAYFLGFQIGLLAILSSHKGTVLAALVAPLFVLALPIIDTALAILRRGLRGLPIFRPDRTTFITICSTAGCREERWCCIFMRSRWFFWRWASPRSGLEAI